MKKITLLLTLILSLTVLSSCQDKAKKVEKNPVEVKKEVVKTDPQTDLVANGKALFTAKTCTTCHKADTKLVGPSLQTIAKTYAEKKGDLLKFFKGESKAIVDPAMAAIMDANVQSITKPMAEADLKALAAYIESTVK
jgi:cytochrome c